MKNGETTAHDGHGNTLHEPAMQMTCQITDFYATLILLRPYNKRYGMAYD